MNSFQTLADDITIEKVISGLKDRNIEGIVVNTRSEALEKIKSLIPPGVSVMSGASRTLEEIGYIEYLKSGQHGWKNLKEDILAEKDPVKQGELRKTSVLSDYYLGSVHALVSDGQMIIASNSGSQLPHLVFTSKNIILVVSSQKITQTFEDGMRRLEEYVYPLENKRMKETGAAGSAISKILIFRREPPFLKRLVHVIIVKEKLGF